MKKGCFFTSNPYKILTIFCLVFSEIQDSNYFERDLIMAAVLEDDLFNPLPLDLTGL